MFAKVAVLVLLAGAVMAQQKSYRGDKVFRLVPTNEDQLSMIRQFLEAPSDQFDFWDEPTYVNSPVDIHIGAQSVAMFTNLMNTANIPFSQLIGDVQEMIDEVEAANAKNSRTNRASIVGTFPTFDQMNIWLQEICDQSPDLAYCGDVGVSYEKRTFKYIKLGKAAAEGVKKQKIWVEGTMHAREWLSPATIVYIIDRLVNKYNTDPEAKRMLDTYDWYIVPISNPDGYVYTLKERLWRKTRSKPAGAACYGADPNRNWNYTWGQPGASASACSDTYRGVSAFSEPETKALSDFIWANKDNSRVYFSIHTYSQLWLIPYGYGKPTSKPDDFTELERVAKVGAAALQAVNKKTWKVGNIVDLLYEASGGSLDWAKAVAGIKYSYCLELRPAKGAINGFVVKETEIDPSGREVWAGLIAAIDAIPN